MSTNGIAAIASESEVTETRKRLEEHRQALADARAMLGRLAADREAILIEQAVNGKADPRALGRLEEEERGLGRTISRETVIVGGLEKRVGTWQAAEDKRRYERNLATLTQIAASGPELERRYCAAASALVEAARELLEAQRAYDLTAAEMQSYQAAYRLPGIGVRRPHRPFQPPMSYFRDPKPYLGWPQWLSEWQKTHP